jgi:hypothetical protein
LYIHPLTAGNPVKFGYSSRYCDYRILVPMPFLAALAGKKVNQVETASVRRPGSMDYTKKLSGEKL